MNRTVNSIKTAAMLTALLLATACKDFDELQTDPNRTTQTHPSLLLTGVEVSSFQVISLDNALASRMLTYTDGSSNTQYYGWQRSGFGQYNTLRQVVKMEEEADRLGLANYKALVLFFKAFNILELSKTFGDVPYASGLQGSTGALRPAYDTQKDIYRDVLEQLKTANSMLDASKEPITGDVIYGGTILNWKKLINSLSLRVLMSLSAKTGNTDLNVIARFKEIYDNPAQYPIFESNADNAALVYHDIATNRYPLFNNNGLKTAYYMDESFVNLLKDNEDPRLFTFADRTRSAVNLGLAEDDFDAYGGVDGSAQLSTNTQRVVAGEASPIDARYHSNAINEPGVALGYAEVEFTLAEAAQRGWITASAADHYVKGIRASMDFYKVDAAAQDDYVAQTGVVYVPLDGIEMINTQKYISFYMNTGWEAFYNQRRTGFPLFKVDGGGVLNSQKIPKRWMYPQSELEVNAQNIQDAIARQYPEGDDINATMWLLKAE